MLDAWNPLKKHFHVTEYTISLAVGFWQLLALCIRHMVRNKNNLLEESY
jgi:hypothetical protein